MFIVIVVLVGTLGRLSSGIPLESPSSDLKQFFSERIVGGVEAELGRAPYMAALLIDNWFLCGGSIISQRHILTAAHCMAIHWDGTLMPSFHAVVGTNNRHKGTVVKFKDYRNHPYYNPWLIKNDTGVIITKENIQMNERVAVIGLDSRPIRGGEKVFATGWGTQALWGDAPDFLQILYMETLSYKECVASFREVAHIIGYTPPVDEIVEICTFHSPGHGMCHGDSGSALILRKLGLQIGIVSWGVACAIGAPDVFSSISGQIGFIESVIRII